LQQRLDVGVAEAIGAERGVEQLIVVRFATALGTLGERCEELAGVGPRTWHGQQGDGPGEEPPIAAAGWLCNESEGLRDKDGCMSPPA